MNKRQLLYLSVILIISVSCKGGNRPVISTVKADTTDVWVPDNSDGTYKNPVIYADYSDPDVIRRGDEYYLIFSSFNCVPGIPVLHSSDLVNWKIIGHVMNRLKPDDYFSLPRHGQGVWAPSLRYYDGEFYIYYGDPDFGIYMTKAENPAGPWTDPVLVKKAKDWIDPCPFWDENGDVYLVLAWAGSRSGIKSILTINRMTSDGTRLLDDGVIIFDGHDWNSTVEGSPESRQGAQVPDSSVIYFRCVLSDNALCEFYYSLDGKNFVPFGSAFAAKPGRWIGAKTGLFCTGITKTNDVGYIDVDWIRIEKL